jgi:dihydroorotate dehydrogenase electron transfer subunit
MTAHRGSIFLEDATVIEHTAYAGDQFILRVEAPECAKHAVPGSFAHIQCDPDIAMRRPLSIMRADPETGHVDFLYKLVGLGLRTLSLVPVGRKLSMLGPIGNGFSPDPQRPRKLMLGGGVGIPPMSFLAEQLHQNDFDSRKMLVLMGSEVPFPFPTQQSAIAVAGITDDVSESISSLEQLGIAARLTSLQGFAGCHQGYVTDLGRQWLAALPEQERNKVELFACGPEPMLQAVALLAQEFELPCQLCLEEFMACAVGGCAGCTVPVHLPEGIAMKRVCVDGPVFAADTIYPQ